jgi:fatty-acid desaturase
MADDPTTSTGERDLAGRAMGAIDLVVDTLHDKVIRPILLIGRTVAFAFIIVVCVSVIAVALCVALLRLLDVYAFGAHQWASWALLGAIFVTGGLVIWRWRKTTAKSEGAR